MHGKAEGTFVDLRSANFDKLDERRFKAAGVDGRLQLQHGFARRRTGLAVVDTLASAMVPGVRIS